MKSGKKPQTVILCKFKAKKYWESNLFISNTQSIAGTNWQKGIEIMSKLADYRNKRKKISYKNCI